MRETSLLPVLVVCLLYCVGRSLSAPGRSADEVLIGEVDIAMHDDDDGGGGGGAGGGVVGSSDDDSPEVTTEEAFAKECIVDNKAYAHSQMIPSHDQSSHCLCVAGEVYCWWQTYGVPISFSSSSTFKSSSFDESNDVDSWTTEEDDYSVEGPSESPEAESSGESSGEQLDDNSEELEDDDDNEAAEIESNDIPVEMRSNKNSTAKITTTTTTTTTSTMATMTSVRPTQHVPTTCLVMGRTYQVGEALPHSTGNCVECSCGSEGRIECSPKDCVGLRPQNPGGGDLELFELERDGTF